MSCMWLYLVLNFYMWVHLSMKYRPCTTSWSSSLHHMYLVVQNNYLEMHLILPNLGLLLLLIHCHPVNEEVLKKEISSSQVPFLLVSKPLIFSSCQQIWRCITPTFRLMLRELSFFTFDQHCILTQASVMNANIEMKS